MKICDGYRKTAARPEQGPLARGDLRALVMEARTGKKLAETTAEATSDVCRC